MRNPLLLVGAIVLSWVVVFFSPSCSARPPNFKSFSGNWQGKYYIVDQSNPRSLMALKRDIEALVKNIPKLSYPLPVSDLDAARLCDMLQIKIWFNSKAKQMFICIDSTK